MRPVLLAIDDDATFLDSLKLMLQSVGEVLCASNLQEGRDSLRDQSIDLVITDYQMSSGTGHDVIRMVRETYSKLPVILVTAFADKDMAVQSANLHVFALLEKPIELRVLHDVVGRALVAGRTDASHSGSPSSCSPELAFDYESNVVSYRGERYPLTDIQLGILGALVASSGKRVSRDEIIHAVWGNARLSHNLFDTHLLNLRKKLPFLRDHLQVVRGKGYIYRALQL